MSVPDPFCSTTAPRLWSSGPSPGAIYPFPDGQTTLCPTAQPTTHTLRPMVTGTSVLGLTFSDGVMLAADTLGEM